MMVDGEELRFNSHDGHTEVAKSNRKVALRTEESVERDSAGSLLFRFELINSL